MFKEYPTLKPGGERVVQVSLERIDGQPFMLFSLQTASVRMRRKGSATGEGNEQAARAGSKNARAQSTASTPNAAAEIEEPEAVERLAQPAAETAGDWANERRRPHARPFARK